MGLVTVITVVVTVTVSANYVFTINPTNCNFFGLGDRGGGGAPFCSNPHDSDPRYRNAYNCRLGLAHQCPKSNPDPASKFELKKMQILGCRLMLPLPRP